MIKKGNLTNRSDVFVRNENSFDVIEGDNVCVWVVLWVISRTKDVQYGDKAFLVVSHCRSIKFSKEDIEA